MTNSDRWIRTTLLLSLIVGLLGFPGLAQKPTLRIGVVVDGPWERNQEIRGTFEREVTALLQRDYDIQFPADKRIAGDWTAAGIREAVDRLLADPDIDYVITLGVLGSNVIAHHGTLPKPAVAPFVLDVDLQEIPVEVREKRYPGREAPERFRVSGVPELSYVVVGTDIAREVSRFLEIVPFSRLTILSMRAFRESIPQLRDNAVSELRQMGLEVGVVDVGDSLEEALARIPPDTEAVYVAPLLQLPEGDFERLVQALIDRQLPSFSLWGRSEVEKGLLASLALDLDMDRIARRVAINLQRIIRGERAEDLPVDFERDERLTLNVATARAIGVYPSWELETEADLLNVPRSQAARLLSLEDVVLEASRVNLDLAVADRTVAAGFQLVREARGVLLPQLNALGQAILIDKDRAEASLGTQGRRQINGGFALSQLVYSEDARAQYDIERNLQDLRAEDRAQVRLDVILEAAEAYLNVLRTKTAERIQRDNLRVTRRNLELATARRQIGYSGPGEVIRWESQIATNRRDVIEVNASKNVAEIQLNRVLNHPIEESFLTRETSLDDPELKSTIERLRPYIDNRETFRLFRQFMALEGFEGSPELRQLDASIAAQERAVLAAKRVFYVPTVDLQAELKSFKNGGAGSSSPFAEAPPTSDLVFPLRGNLDWTVAFNASLPLFRGTSLRAQRTRAEIELDEFVVQREATRQRVEQRTRSALHESQASFAGINLARVAADAALRNLDLVTDSYSQGTVEIVRLLDAQNEALVAELVAATAVYDFLIDWMNVQRAVGRFDYYRSAAERDAFFERIEAHYEQAGFQVRPR